jgi:hypothetical protein
MVEDMAFAQPTRDIEAVTSPAAGFPLKGSSKREGLGAWSGAVHHPENRL